MATPRETLILIALLFLVTNCKTTSAIAIDCSYTMMPFSVAGTVYTCVARVLFDDNDENITTVFGVHETGKGLEDVLGLYIRSQNLPFVPRNIEAFFPNILALDLVHNAISNISNSHLIPFPNLKFLSLWDNRFTSLDSNIFSGLSALGYIAFSNNNIRHIGHDINLPSSGQIYFNGNPCISKQAVTPEQIETLKLDFLRNCPPTISQIEDTLESRPNLLTSVDGQVQSLISVTDELDDEVKSMSNTVSYLNNSNTQLEGRATFTEARVTFAEARVAFLEERVAYLEAIIENKLGIKLEEPLNEN